MYTIFSFLFFISLLCIPIFIILSFIISILKRPNKKYAEYAKTSAFIFVVSIFGLMFTYKAPPAESINLFIPDQQTEYDINTKIPIDVSVFPENADEASLAYIATGEGLKFTKSGIVTGSEEGIYDLYIESGDIISNKISLTVIDMAAREAEEQRLAEEKAAEEAEERRLAEEKAAQEAEERRLAEEQRLAEEKAAQEEQRRREASASSDSTSQNSASSSGDSGNAENFNTYDNAEQQQTTASFVLNTSTHKIHYPSCRDVPKIKPQNYSTSNQSVSELEAQGYTTCGHCFK